MEKYAAEVSDFSFIPIRPIKNRLRVSLGITGYVRFSSLSLTFRLTFASCQMVVGNQRDRGSMDDIK